MIMNDKILAKKVELAVLMQEKSVLTKEITALLDKYIKNLEKLSKELNR